MLEKVLPTTERVRAPETGRGRQYLRAVTGSDVARISDHEPAGPLKVSGVLAWSRCICKPMIDTASIRPRCTTLCRRMADRAGAPRCPERHPWRYIACRRKALTYDRNDQTGSVRFAQMRLFISEVTSSSCSMKASTEPYFSSSAENALSI